MDLSQGHILSHISHSKPWRRHGIKGRSALLLAGTGVGWEKQAITSLTNMLTFEQETLTRCIEVGNKEPREMSILIKGNDQRRIKTLQELSTQNREVEWACVLHRKTEPIFSIISDRQAEK